MRRHKALISEEFQRVLSTLPKPQSVTCTNEQHIFRTHTSPALAMPTKALTARVPMKKTATALSQLVEYPGDPVLVASLLATGQEAGVTIGGKDLLGYTALHKFASWDKVDLIELLLPHLTWEEVAVPAGWPRDDSSYTGYCVLHLCVDSGAWRALEYLLLNCDARIVELVDKNGKTFIDLARDRGCDHLIRFTNGTP